MPTRKELLADLRNEIDRLSDTVTNESEALERHGDTQIQAAEIISGALTKASGDVLAAVVIGGFSWLIGRTLIDHIRAINKKTDLIKSIQFLQERHSSLSYEFVVERSSVVGATRDERQSILNELIHDDIVTVVENSDKGETLFIDAANPELIEYWERVDSIKELAIGQHEKLSQE